MKNLTESDNFDIRYSTAQDEEHLRKWLLAPGVNHWFTMEDKSEITEMARIWASFHRIKSSLTAVYKGKPCAMATLFLMPYVKVAHMAMGYIVVSPEMQKKGVGTALIKNIEHLAKNFFKLELLQFEIYGDSPLIPCLMKRGFKAIFKQEKFVKEQNGSYLPRTLLEMNFKNDG